MSKHILKESSIKDIGYLAIRMRDIKKFDVNMSLNQIVMILLDQKLKLEFPNIETKHNFYTTFI